MSACTCQCECRREPLKVEVTVSHDDVVKALRKAIRLQGGDVQAVLGTPRRDVPPAFVSSS